MSPATGMALVTMLGMDPAVQSVNTHITILTNSQSEMHGWASASLPSSRKSRGHEYRLR